MLFSLVLSLEIVSDLGVGYVQRRAVLAFPFVLAALPIIFTSLKGGVMAAVNGAIVGELFGAFEGLGYMILDSRYVGNTVRVFLAAAFCTLIGWILLGIVTVAERVLLPWHMSMARDSDAQEHDGSHLLPRTSTRHGQSVPHCRQRRAAARGGSGDLL